MINTQALMNLVSYAEQRGVKMDSWFCYDEDDFFSDSSDWNLLYAASEMSDMCGTVGCLLGTYLVAEKERFKSFFDRQRSLDHVVWNHVEGICEHLGISEAEFNWLFTWERKYWRSGISRCCNRLEEATSEKAIRRVRRFIYFKLKQAEIHEAWNERHHTRGAECKNTSHVRELAGCA